MSEPRRPRGGEAGRTVCSIAVLALHGGLLSAEPWQAHALDLLQRHLLSPLHASLFVVVEYKGHETVAAELMRRPLLRPHLFAES